MNNDLNQETDIQELINESNRCVQQGDADKAIELRIEALNKAKEHGLKKEEAKLARGVGVLYRNYKNNPAVALDFFNHSIDVAEDISDPTQCALSYLDKANTILIVSGTDVATEFIEKGEEYFNSLKLEVDKENQKGIEVIARVCSDIGTFYGRTGNKDRTGYYFSELSNIVELIERENVKVQHLSNIGEHHSQNEDFEKAIEYFEKVLEIGRRIEYPQAIKYGLINGSNAYTGSGNHQKALELLQEAECMINEEDRLFTDMLKCFGVTYRNLEEWVESENYLNEALDVIRDKAEPKLRLYEGDLHAEMARLYRDSEADGHMEKAWEEYERAVNIYNELILPEKIKAMEAEFPKPS